MSGFPFTDLLGGLGAGPDITPSSALGKQTGTNVIQPTIVQNFGGSEEGTAELVESVLNNLGNTTKRITAPDGFLGGLGIQQGELNVLLIGGLFGVGLFLLDRFVLK